MATLRNKRKLAVVSRETPESTRNGRVQNALDPELTQDYISKVSEETEGRVTKKPLKEFSRTESRILGALSNFDVSSEPTCSDLFRSRSGNIQEQQLREPGNHWGSFLRGSLPRGEKLFASFWSFKQPWGRRLSSQILLGNANWNLLSYTFVGNAKYLERNNQNFAIPPLLVFWKHFGPTVQFFWYPLFLFVVFRISRTGWS